MRHLVSATPPIASAHTVKRYAGYGILGADLPTGGDHGPSPALNDDISPSAEYYWRVATPPSDGVLTIYADLSFLWDATGVADGWYPWVYRLYQDHVDAGTATVQQIVGPHQITVPASTQATLASPAAVRQTHSVAPAGSAQGQTASSGAISQTHGLVGSASSQGIVATAASISQSATTYVAGSQSAQATTASAASVRQTHLLNVAAAIQALAASAAAIRVTHAVVAAASAQATTAAPASVTQWIAVYVAGSHSVQATAASAATVRQTHQLAVASAQLTAQTSAAAVAQTHLVRAASSQHALIASPASASEPGSAVYPLPPDVRLGVVYGPSGIEYTGTLTASAGATLRARLDAAQATTAFTAPVSGVTATTSAAFARLQLTPERAVLVARPARAALAARVAVASLRVARRRNSLIAAPPSALPLQLTTPRQTLYVHRP